MSSSCALQHAVVTPRTLLEVCLTNAWGIQAVSALVVSRGWLSSSSARASWLFTT